MIAEPTRTLDPSARWIWRGQQIAGWAVALIIASVGLREVDDTLSLVASLAALVGLVVGVTVIPWLRWRRWRWDVRADAIDIRHGTFVVTQTLIPMLRVQHVETTSGPIERELGLANVVVHTAAGQHRIPLLHVATAAELRERIGELAGNADES